MLILQRRAVPGHRVLPVTVTTCFACSPWEGIYLLKQLVGCPLQNHGPRCGTSKPPSRQRTARRERPPYLGVVYEVPERTVRSAPGGMLPSERSAHEDRYPEPERPSAERSLPHCVGIGSSVGELDVSFTRLATSNETSTSRNGMRATRLLAVARSFARIRSNRSRIPSSVWNSRQWSNRSNNPLTRNLSMFMAPETSSSSKGTPFASDLIIVAEVFISASLRRRSRHLQYHAQSARSSDEVELDRRDST